jgi:cytochrome d ubiquinol oxidase subunit II
VWLIFVLVVFWTGFPTAFGAVASTLYIPLFGGAVGIILRGSAFAFRGVVGGGRGGGSLYALFSLSSLLTPFFLGSAVGGIASGRVPLGNAEGDPVTSWLNPTSVTIGLIAVATGAHLAAVYSAADARRAGWAEIADAFRARALVSGVAAGALALGGILVLREDARPLYDGLTGDGVLLVGLSAAAGVATLALVQARRFAPARVTAALATASIVWGWAVAQRPDLLPGAVTVEDAAAGRPTLVALLIGLAVGTAVVAPAMAWLFRLALAGRLGKDLGPPAGSEEAP